jgi:hypothetical protein
MDPSPPASQRDLEAVPSIAPPDAFGREPEDVPLAVLAHQRVEHGTEIG